MIDTLLAHSAGLLQRNVHLDVVECDPAALHYLRTVLLPALGADCRLHVHVHGTSAQQWVLRDSNNNSSKKPTAGGGRHSRSSSYICVLEDVFNRRGKVWDLNTLRFLCALRRIILPGALYLYNMYGTCAHGTCTNCTPYTTRRVSSGWAPACPPLVAFKRVLLLAPPLKCGGRCRTRRTRSQRRRAKREAEECMT